MYRGSLHEFYLNKGTNESLDVVSPHLNVDKKEMRHYLSNILKWDTQRYYMKGEIDHWLDFFQEFQQ